MTVRLGMVATLYGFWLALSGMFTPLLLAAGLAAAVGVAALARRMELADREGHPLHLALEAAAYWPWLLKEIAKSAWQVSRIILAPRLRLGPSLVRFRPSQRSTLGLVIHANSITLTPGTVTVEAGQGEFLVHALTPQAAAGLAGSEMDRRVSRLEGVV